MARKLTSTEAAAKNSNAAPDAWKEPFLNALRLKPIVGYACRVAGVGRTTAYKYRNIDEEFEKAWDDAVDEGKDRLEEDQLDKAVEGNTAIGIFLMKCWRYGGADVSWPKGNAKQKLQVGWE